jgi:hypothetical protein
MPKSTQAKGLDIAARRMHRVARIAAGKTGGKMADALANLLLAPVRRRVR